MLKTWIDYIHEKKMFNSCTFIAVKMLGENVIRNTPAVTELVQSL